MKKSILMFAALCAQLFAEPTEVREWHSTAGTKIEAAALGVEGGRVSLKTKDGRQIKVPLDKFTGEDQEILREHFEIKAPKPGEPVTSDVPLIEGGLEHPLGEVSGPVDVGGGSTCFIYVPKTLREGRKAPLMFLTGAGGARAKHVSGYAGAAEVNGWILAASVESRNGPNHPEGNHQHAKRCVEYLLDKLPIDEERVYFTGNSGGGAMSFYNALRIKSAGNMPIVGYSPDKEYDKKQYCYGIGGTTDFNRYLTAHAVSQFGNRGFHRFHAQGHGTGPGWYGEEGITWLNGRFLGDRRKDSELDDERLDYEAAMIGWIRKLRESEAHRAHYWCGFLTEEYEIGGPNAAIVAKLFEELNADPVNISYTEGIAALDEFSDKHFASEGGNGGSASEHTSPKIKSAAEKLAEKYAGVPEIEALAKGLGKPTVKVK